MIFVICNLITRCNLKIEDFAFTEVFQTLQKLEIKGVQLGSNQLINNLAKHFKNLTNLILTNNEIDSIDPDMIPESVKDMEISKNNLKCDCNTLDDLRILKKRLDVINIHEMQCPENNNITFANAYEKLNCLQLIESTKNNERITLILIFLTITLVIIVAMILYLIRRRRVRTMKPKHVSQPLLPTDQNCVFDIFISYAEADWQIMEEIFRNLSNGSLNQNSFKLAFNEKDCIPGKMGKIAVLSCPPPGFTNSKFQFS